jgi:hypothetical protein
MEVYNRKMAYLTAEDKAFFKENGFLVVRDALNPQVVSEAQDVLWSHMGQVSEEIDRKRPDTWINKGYHVLRCGSEAEIKRLVYADPVFAMAEELVGKGLLHTDGGAGPHVNFPRDEQEWNPPKHGHLDGYHTLSNGVPKGTVSQFTLGVAVYLSQINAEGGGFTVWPGSHKVWGEFFRYHDVDCLPGGIAPFDLGESYEFTGKPGDVCLWHSLLTHTAGHNISRNVRIACIARPRRKDLDQIRYDFPKDMWKYWEGIN